MTIQTPAIGIPGPRRGPGRRLAIGLAAVIAVAVAAVVIWQVTRDEEAAVLPEAIIAPAAVDPVAVARPTSPPAATTYNLVASQAQAEAVARGISEANAIRAEFGELPFDEHVLQVDTVAGTTLLRMLGEQDAIRDQLGLSPVSFIDLRLPVVDGAADQAAPLAARITDSINRVTGPVPLSTSTGRPEVVYLVSTEEEASVVTARINQAAQIRDDLARALPSTPSSISRITESVIVVDATSVDIVVQLISDMSRSSLQVVDLRTP